MTRVMYDSFLAAYHLSAKEDENPLAKLIGVDVYVEDNDVGVTTRCLELQKNGRKPVPIMFANMDEKVMNGKKLEIPDVE